MDTLELRLDIHYCFEAFLWRAISLSTLLVCELVEVIYGSNK